MNGMIKNFFNDSASQFASFFTKETNLSKTELEELRKIIDKEIKSK
jgi:predicted transcriptional regulator